MADQRRARAIEGTEDIGGLPAAQGLIVTGDGYRSFQRAGDGAEAGPRLAALKRR
jgi:hypothetical protein